MKTTWKILIAIGVFLLVILGISYVSMRFQPASELDVYKKSLRDRGEKLEISEVQPPPVAPESNSVDAVESAFRLFGSGYEHIPDAMKMVAPGKAMVGWSRPDARSYDFTNSWNAFADGMAADGPAIELLHQVLDKPRLDFQLDYKKGVLMLVPQLAPLKRATQKLDAAAILDLHTGDNGAAVTNILTMLELVQKNASEGLIISHLVRIAMAAIAVVPTWELLQATNVADAQLAAVQKGWEHLDFLSDAENAFVIERAWGLALIRKSRASHKEFEDAFGSSVFMSKSGGSVGSGWSWESLTERPRYAVAEIMWRSSWSYSDELCTLQSETIILDTLRTMQTNRSQFYQADYEAMKTQLSSLGITNAGAAFFRALNIPDFSEVFGDSGLVGVVGKTLRIEAARRVVVTAIALKRFQLKHGKLPETLADLMPEFIPSVPIDPYDGKPLRYHPNADGTYLLYSVAEDAVDDGGDPTLPPGIISSSLYWQNNHARDWVWPQPATPAEIKYFYEHPPK